VIDIDATLVGSHSEKEGAAPTYKRGFGFHPINAHLDATGEALAGLLRPGNAGSGTAADHITVLDDALALLPIDPTATEVDVRADSAGCSHDFLEASGSPRAVRDRLPPHCRDRHSAGRTVRTGMAASPSPRMAPTSATTPRSPRSPGLSTCRGGPTALA
jgi:hypothetical protein